MTRLITTALLGVIFVEILNNLSIGNTLSKMNRLGHKVIHVLSSRKISDHWKEKALACYSGMLFLAALRLAFLLFVLGATAIASIFLCDYLGADIAIFVTHWTGTLYLASVATAYALIRWKLIAP